MDLKRRLKLFGIGLIIGGGAAYIMMGDRLSNGGWTPEARIKQRLRSTLLKTTTVAEQQLAARALQLADVRRSLDSASVDLGDTRRTDDSIYYTVDTRLHGRDARLVVVALRDFDRDSTATLWSIADR